eukprot:PhF_6_TR6122/c0_g1_i1/m.9042
MEDLRLEIAEAFHKLKTETGGMNHHKSTSAPPPPVTFDNSFLVTPSTNQKSNTHNHAPCNTGPSPQHNVSHIELDQRIMRYVRDAIADAFSVRVADVEAKVAHANAQCESNARVLCEVAAKIVEVYTELKGTISQARELTYSDFSDLRTQCHSKFAEVSKVVDRLGHHVEDIKAMMASEEKTRTSVLEGVATNAVRSALRHYNDEHDRMSQATMKRVTDVALGLDEVRSKVLSVDTILQGRITAERTTASEVESIHMDVTRLKQKLSSLAHDSKVMGQDIHSISKRCDEVSSVKPQQCITQCPGSLALHQRLNTEIVLVKQSVAFIAKQMNLIPTIPTAATTSASNNNSSVPPVLKPTTPRKVTIPPLPISKNVETDSDTDSDPVPEDID